MFRDEFTDFVFNGVESKNMKVWMTNARDLKDRISPEVTNNFVSPAYSDGRYYSGSTISGGDITVSCAAINITEDDKRAIALWLGPRQQGRLQFGYDMNHYYDVIIGGEIVAEKWVKSKYDDVLGKYLYIYTFTVKFSTLSDWTKLGNPVNINLRVLEDSTDANYDSESFNNIRNDYLMPYIVRNSISFVPAGTTISTKTAAALFFLESIPLDENGEIDWTSSVTYGANGDRCIIRKQYQNLYIEAGLYKNNNLVDKNSFYCFYDSIIVAADTNANLNTANDSLFFVNNMGNQPMYFNLTCSGESIQNNAENIFSLTKNGVDWLKYKNASAGEENTESYIIHYNSLSAFVTYNGVLISKSLSDKNVIRVDSSMNEGPLSIETGHPEKFAINTIIKQDITYGEDKKKLATLYIVNTKNKSKFNHYGCSCLSMYPGFPNNDQGFSNITDGETISFLNEHVHYYNGYTIPTDNGFYFITSYNNRAIDATNLFASLCESTLLNINVYDTFMTKPLSENVDVYYDTQTRDI